MTPINFHKKEKPLTSLVSMGGGAAGMAHAGAADGKTYIDDVFSTYVYKGNQTVRSLNSGIDLAAKGGMVWFKNRTHGWSNRIWDTERGQTKYLYTSEPDAQLTDTAPGQNNNMVASFDSNGVTLGKDDTYGGTNYQDDFVNWQFRKAKGFFDVVTYTGTASGSGQQIPHNLGCIPGCILIKRLDASNNWAVYHRGYNQGVDPWHYRARLNTTQVAGNNNWFNDTAPTSTHFSVGGAHGETDGLDGEYVAYLFAGGMSTGAGAHSIFYNGSGDRIRCGDANNKTADFNFGAFDLTIECWIKCSTTQGTYPRVVAIGPQWEAEMAALQWDHDENANKVSFYCYNHSSSTSAPLLRSTVKGFNGDGQWHHIAVSKNGTTWRLFVDGMLEDIATWSGSTNTGDSYCTIGNTPGSATTAWFGGYISNVRIVKGQGLYTSSFRPSLEPLTTTSQGATASNVKLLCCNNLSGTAATVTPIALTETNINQNQTENPFDDPAGNKFGENEDQNLIKCGYFKGNGAVQSIDVGFEPQWVMIKNVDWGSGWWCIHDSMRGAANRPGDNDQKGLFANDNQQEVNGNYVGMYSRGFKLLGGESSTNRNGDYHVYVAIRRPDGLVGKPPSEGNEVYTQVYGTTNNDIPAFNSGFVTDFTFFKEPAGTGSWFTQERLHGVGYMVNTTTAAESDSGNNTWDFMDGYYKATGNWGPSMNWMWKRGAGFDVVDWDGNGVVRHIQHSLGQAPQFMIVKRRSAVEDWTCYHYGLNNGVNPAQYYIQMNGNNGQGQYTDYEPGNFGNYNMWNYEDPTDSHIAIGRHDRVNTSGHTYMALLFASAKDALGNQISKVGYYQGQGSDQTITFGFQPRFIMVKATDAGGGDWNIYDSTRGLVSGADQELRLNNTTAQTGHELGDVTATGFTFACGGSHDTCSAGKNFIYYAHA